ncbi:hypothetical protein S7335_710 [Synechococcus sp. PCC 7335]|uniref:class I SAM-dependent methyltransferase n=1 Tax=Synechococcus sp. (strain ATCC 29403 / PCC 7335) TaxID=91464 RepID=UPI00017EB53E|nr:class I SAM-dependent methyltransferase [Synechococcus sp. PCC 7335]EDX83530.1 hypothetical protein S7335_710 [Synechococcus sp. PCC 7335]
MTTNPSDRFDAISPTAMLVAYARQFSDIPFAVELARLIDVSAMLRLFPINSQNDILLLSALIEARYKAVDEAISSFENKQIFELASGLLPRGMKMTQDSEVVFVESDLPAVIQLKQALVAQVVSMPSNLRFKEADAASYPNQLLIGADYLKDNEPVTILCEGLLQYLSLTEKVQLFANIREMLQRYGGVWITSDLSTKQSQAQVMEHSPASHQLHQSIIQTSGRHLLNNSFNDRVEIKQFVSEQGFQIEEHSLIGVMNRLSCFDIVGDKPKNFEAFLETRYISILTLESR